MPATPTTLSSHYAPPQVMALNQRGQANVALVTETGWSGEDVPSQAPADLTIEEVLGPKTAR